MTPGPSNARSISRSTSRPRLVGGAGAFDTTCVSINREAVTCMRPDQTALDYIHRLIGRHGALSASEQVAECWYTGPDLLSGDRVDARDRQVHRIEQLLCIIRAELRLGGIAQSDHGLPEIRQLADRVGELAVIEFDLRVLQLAK